MQPLFEHRRSFAGFETRVLELEGGSPGLVLLHGFADSADTWRLVLARLAAAGRRALAVDVPGFATASHLAAGPVLPQLDRFVDAVVEEACEDGEVVVSGNSLGGTLCLRAAERCDGLPLAGAIPIAPAGFDMAAWLMLIERNPLLQALLAVPVPLPEPVVREAVARVYRTLVFARPGDIDREIVSTFTSHHRDRATVVRYLSTARRLLPELARPYHLDQIRCPVLVVWGERDRLVSPTGIDQLLAALPDTQVELLTGCGHCPQIEEPDRLADLLLGFPRVRSQSPVA